MRKRSVTYLAVAIAVVSLACITPLVQAADPPPPNASKLAKLHQLLEQSHFAESVNQDKSICIEQSLTGLYSPDNFARDHGSYRGFKPGTPQWPEVVAAYEAYVRKACSYYVPEKLEPGYIKYYDSVLSEADLDAYLAFEKTPAAQHMLAAQAGAQKFWAEEIQEAREPVTKEADAQLAKSLSAICDELPWYKSIFCTQ